MKYFYQRFALYIGAIVFVVGTLLLIQINILKPVAPFVFGITLVFFMLFLANLDDKRNAYQAYGKDENNE